MLSSVEHEKFVYNLLTPLHSKTGVYIGIHCFLIFALKHRSMVPPQYCLHLFIVSMILPTAEEDGLSLGLGEGVTYYISEYGDVRAL